MNHVVVAPTTIIGKYQSKDFNVLPAATDNGFDTLEENTFIKSEVVLNLTSEDEHGPYIDRFNQSLKEQCRMVYVRIPSLLLPRRMVVKLVYSQVYWFNFTIPESYIFTFIGLAAIIFSRIYDYDIICGQGSNYGEYMQMHKKTDNTMHTRTASVICF